MYVVVTMYFVVCAIFNNIMEFGTEKKRSCV